MLSLFSSYIVIKLLFSFIILADVLNSLISRYLLAGCRLHLGFLEKLVRKAGFYISFVFQAIEKLFTHPMNLCFAVFCNFLGDFGEYLGGDSFSRWISEI